MRKIGLLFAVLLGSLPLTGQVSVFQTNTGPTIDGTLGLGEWTNATVFSIDQLVDGSASGISGSVSLLWDSNNIYALFQVSDDLRGDDSADGNGIANSLDSFNDDSVEFYFANSTSATGAMDGTTKFQYRINPGNNQELEATPLFTSPTGVSFFSTDTGTNSNYFIELAIDWDTLNVASPTIGSSYRFLAGINDDDDGGSRDSQLFWFATDSASYQIAQDWGVIELAAIPEPSTVAFLMGLTGLGAWLIVKRRRIQEV
jgi:hypothetical protein